MALFENEIKNALNVNKSLKHTNTALRSVTPNILNSGIDALVTGNSLGEAIRKSVVASTNNIINSFGNELRKSRLPNIPGIEYLRNAVADAIGFSDIHPSSENRRELDNISLRLRKDPNDLNDSVNIYDDPEFRGSDIPKGPRKIYRDGALVSGDVNITNLPSIYLSFTDPGIKQPMRIALYNNMQTISESKAANWSETNIPGRFEPIPSYDSSGTKSFTITGLLLLDTGEDDSDTTINDLQNLVTNLSLIKASVYPREIAGKTTGERGGNAKFKSGREYSVMSAPPLWRLRFYSRAVQVTGNTGTTQFKGDLLFNTLVRINDYTIEYMSPLLDKGFPAITQVTLNLSEVNVSSENNRLSFINVPNRGFYDAYLGEINRTRKLKGKDFA
jgi:hypothetical protein